MDWFYNFSPAAQTAIISAVVSLIISIISFPLKVYIEKCILRYKLNKEYEFEQKKKIKDSLAQIKTPVIKAAEELSFRLWSFSNRIDKGWHIYSEKEPNTTEKYYFFRSTVYRLLVFLYWVDKAERDLYDLDFSIAGKGEKLYLKYIKVLKNFFCESSLLRDLKYNTFIEDAHFYRDHIKTYTDYVKAYNSTLTYDEFVKKFDKDHTSITTVINYISKIKKNSHNYQYNIISSFHLFLILFLNKYGLDYHYTSEEQFKSLASCYKDISIKPALIRFFEQNKIDEEVKWIKKYLNSPCLT